MKQEKGLLAKTVKLFTAIGRKLAGGEELGKVDSAVLKVAMMIAALDGDVTEGELEAFEKLARQCRGFTRESADQVFDEGLRAAGYLVLQAKRFGAKRLVGLFVDEATAAMPDGFALADGADVRRAFVMWTVMAMADGDYSAVERTAITAFRRRLDEIVDRVNAYNAKRVAAYVPAYARAFMEDGGAFRFKSHTSDAFMKKVEALVAKLDDAESGSAALQELKELVVKG